LLNVFVSAKLDKLSALLVTFDMGDAEKIVKEELLIISADGIVLNKIPWPSGGVSGATWLNQEEVIINIAGLDQAENKGLVPNSLLVLDPSTQGTRILKSDFPGLFETYPFPYWGEPWGRSLATYNSSLSRVVYLGEGGYTYILWDLQSQKELKQLLHGAGAPPRWAPDGSRFVISAYLGKQNLWPQPDDGLYSVDIDGQISKLINLPNQDGEFVSDYIWSPSGDYLLLLVGNPFSNKVKIYILDTLSFRTLDTCFIYQPAIYSAVPIWSPDEEKILLFSNNETGSDVIMVDLKNKTMQLITKNMEPKGWLKGSQ